MKCLVTGGAGFVGSALAVRFRQQFPSSRIVAFDNLKRRGSELNLEILRSAGIEFVHGDIRNPTDLEEIAGPFDTILECSAEPSVHAGSNGSPNYVLQTNLCGTLNALEFARKRRSTLVFLSTSRVYSIAPLRELQLTEAKTRFQLKDSQAQSGVTKEGIQESFATHLPRSLYGASKLASELMIQEYATTYELPSVINRCGVIAGPGQFGKVDQGVFTLWVARHHFGKSLKYTGFGGKGKQVRDLLHPEDLFQLILKQLESGSLKGDVFNVGGGLARSTSLAELTELCQATTGKQVPVEEDMTTAAADIPYYVSDSRKAELTFQWAPKRSVKDIVEETYQWLVERESRLKPLFC